MKQEFRKIGLATLAAAVGLALGTTAPSAQEREQAGQAEARQGSNQDPLGEQQADQRADQQPGAGERQAGQQAGQEQAGQQAGQEQAGQQAGQEQDSAQASEQQAGQEQDSQQAQAGDSEIDQLAQQNPDLSKFVEAINAAGLGDALTGSTNYTVFAPTNEAFESMQGQSIDDLIASGNTEELVSLLRAHIVADDVSADRAQQIPQALTIDGGTVSLAMENDELSVGEAMAVETDIEVGQNLTVHAIDGVLEPQPAAEVAAASTE